MAHHRNSLPEYTPRLDRRKAESQHISDKLYHQHNGNAKVFDHLSVNRDPYYTQPKAYYEMPAMQGDYNTKPKEPKSVRDVFQRFADTTSLQGIPFITSASRWYAKLLWAVIFLAATGVWLLHSIVLIQSYTAYDTNSQVKITNENLEFPTVTLCNINPIRSNTVSQYGTAELEELFGKLTPMLEPNAGVVNQGRKKRQTQEAEDDDDERNNHDFTVFDDIDFTEYAHVGTFGDYLEGDYSSTTLARLLLQEMVADLPNSNRTQMGHRLTDMLLGCSYDGSTCSKRIY